MILTSPINKKKFNTGIALSGGGIKGLCHAGVLKALDEFKVKADIISGVSAGAIVGALYADGFSPTEISKLFEDISFRHMTNIHYPNGGIFRIDAFEEFLKRTLRAKNIEDLKIPLKIVATDLDKGHSVIFEKGNLVEAIIASCSIPILFVPKNINGVNYVDGGVLKNFPVSVIREECETVIGVNVSPLVVNEYKMNLINVATRTYQFMFKSNTFADKEMCDVLIEPVDMGNFDTFDIEKGHEIFEIGYKSAKEVWEKYNS